jgi:peptide/nickel transport system permease protein
MAAYAARRLAHSVFVLWGALTVIFLAIRVVPGDPALAILGPDASPADLAALRARLGLDRPLAVQYFVYLGRAVRLDFGDSVRLGEPVLRAVLGRFPLTALLAVTATLLAVALSFPLGILAAVKRHSAVDSAVSAFSLVGQSVPSFWLGIVLILVFARELRLLPSAGAESWRHLILPALTLALIFTGVLTRLVRGGMLEVLAEDYVRTARAKGLAPRLVLVRHALPNMLIPVVTVVGLQLGHLLGGAVIVETVFGWPGVGRLLVDAISYRDYPLVQGAVLFITATFIVVNLMVDLSYGYLDPRVRLG